ncbi:hypothetical protein GCM10020219_101250 [Nonomuraea dietziae]
MPVRLCGGGIQFPLCAHRLTSQPERPAGAKMTQTAHLVLSHATGKIMNIADIYVQAYDRMIPCAGARCTDWLSGPWR